MILKKIIVVIIMVVFCCTAAAGFFGCGGNKETRSDDSIYKAVAGSADKASDELDKEVSKKSTDK